MSKEIAVLGAGAIGSSVSADLTKAGYDVTVIDQWPAQVEALKSSGLRIQMPDGEVRVPIRALHLCDLSSANLEFDFVFLTVKSNDDRWMAEFIKPYLKPNGVITCIQNGMNDDSIAGLGNAPYARGKPPQKWGFASRFTPGTMPACPAGVLHATAK